jgi:vancomycin resistance protein YoaR
MAPITIEIKKNNILKYILITTIIVVLTISSILAFRVHTYSGKVLPNVYVGNVDLGGLTVEEANLKLTESTNKDSKISFVMGDEVLKEFSIPSNTLTIDYDKLVNISLGIGRNSNALNNVLDVINTILNIRPQTISTEYEYNTEELNTLINDLNSKYNVEPKDAVFEMSGDRVTNISKETYGKKVDTQKLVNDFKQSLKDLSVTNENKTVEISVNDVKPNKVLSEINDLGIDDLIGEGQSNYSGSMETRVYNLKLAASKFNGVVIPKGGTISFGEIVGDISAESGYKEAYIISGGRTVLDAGGGVCQTSTTLFRAALNTGLSIKERYAHAYRVGYYEKDSLPGLDASIYLPYLDLKIDNNTNGAIVIMVEYEEHNNILRMKMYGKKDDRKVELSTIKVYDEKSAPAPKYVNDYTLKKGIVKQIDWAANGATSAFTYKVTIDGKEAINQEFVSVYQPWQAVYLVGQAN